MTNFDQEVERFILAEDYRRLCILLDEYRGPVGVLAVLRTLIKHDLHTKSVFDALHKRWEEAK